MGYAVAAYIIVLGALALYGLRIHARRRRVMRALAQLGDPGRGPGGEGVERGP